jgi:hypothetical protein
MGFLRGLHSVAIIGARPAAPFTLRGFLQAQNHGAAYLSPRHHATPPRHHAKPRQYATMPRRHHAKAQQCHAKRKIKAKHINSLARPFP